MSLTCLQIHLVERFFQITRMPRHSAVAVAQRIQSTRISAMSMLTQTVNILHRSLAKDHLMLDTSLCRFCKVFRQVANALNIGD